MGRRSHPYRLSWPFTAQQLENVDEMFQLLFDDTGNNSISISASQIRSGTLLGVRGGTGLSTYVIGDLLFADSSSTLDTLAAVASGNALVSAGVGIAPAWGKIILTTHVQGILLATNGGTGLATFTIGDLLYADSSSTLAKLADVATGNALISGGVGAAPSWGKIALTTHVSGDLPFANLTQGSALSVLGVTGNGTADVASIAAGTDHQVLRRSGTALAFGAVNLAQSAAVTGALLAVNGGSGFASYAVGDLLYADTTTTLAKRAAVAVGQVLASAGVNTAPAYSASPALTKVVLSNTVDLIATGAAATGGTVTLVTGTATVNTTAATATCLIFFQRKTAGGTIGFATTYTISAGTSFTVSSDSALDTSTYVWWIVETH